MTKTARVMKARREFPWAAGRDLARIAKVEVQTVYRVLQVAGIRINRRHPHCDRKS